MLSTSHLERPSLPHLLAALLLHFSPSRENVRHQKMMVNSTASLTAMINVEEVETSDIDAHLPLAQVDASSA
jgi:hypothetical protein